MLAWPAVTMPSGPGSFVLASVLSISYVMDHGFAKRGMLPPWYMSLRKPLTIGALAGLTVSMAASLWDPPPTTQKSQLQETQRPAN